MGRRQIRTRIDQLLSLLCKEGAMTVEQLSDTLDVPRERIETWIQPLLDDGLVIRRFSLLSGTRFLPSRSTRARYGDDQ